MIHENIMQLIGNTPLLYLKKFCKENNIQSKIIAKLEYFNPAGSIKDRVAFKMIKDAKDKGLLTKDTVIIEPTSGNTGIGMAAVAAVKGYKVILTMPENMSIERIKILEAYGAEVVLTDKNEGLAGAISKAEELSEAYEKSYIPSQFSNPSNPQAHYTSTGPEIWKQTDGNIDVFVATIGTGGTISGTGKYLKEKNPDIKIIGVEPKDSPVLSEGRKGPHKIQGIGAGFVPDTLDTEVYDEIIAVSNEDAFKAARDVAKSDGVLVGISSGAVLFGALEAAKETKNKNIVVIFPDAAERYLSTELFI